MILLIDKPKGITSHDVVDRLRRVTGIRKIGHAGTLDPNATGLLILGVGRESTKKLGSIAKDTTKTYVAEVFLGEERETDDVEGRLRNKILRQDDKAGGKIVPTLSNLEKVLKQFVGSQNQLPPKYSAIKIKGKKAYELSRKGKEVKLKPRKITIHSIELLDYKYPFLNIRTQVSSGTYIRSLARDIGRKLKTGAYLNNLRRTDIGKYSIGSSVKLEKLTTDNWKGFALQ